MESSSQHAKANLDRHGNVESFGQEALYYPHIVIRGEARADILVKPVSLVDLVGEFQEARVVGVVVSRRVVCAEKARRSCRKAKIVRYVPDLSFPALPHAMSPLKVPHSTNSPPVRSAQRPAQINVFSRHAMLSGPSYWSYWWEPRIAAKARAKAGSPLKPALLSRVSKRSPQDTDRCSAASEATASLTIWGTFDGDELSAPAP